MRAVLTDGTIVPLNEDEASRVLYGLTNLAVTALGPMVNVERIERDDGEVMWQRRDG